MFFIVTVQYKLEAEKLEGEDGCLKGIAEVADAVQEGYLALGNIYTNPLGFSEILSQPLAVTVIPIRQDPPHI